MYNYKSSKLLSKRQPLPADQPAPFPDSEMHNLQPAESSKSTSKLAIKLVTLDQKVSTSSSPNESEDSMEWEEYDMGCFGDNEMNDCATLFTRNKDKKSTQGICKSFEGNASKEEVTDLFLYKTHAGLNHEKNKLNSSDDVFAVLNKQIERIEREKTYQVQEKEAKKRQLKQLLLSSFATNQPKTEFPMFDVIEVASSAEQSSENSPRSIQANKMSFINNVREIIPSESRIIYRGSFQNTYTDSIYEPRSDTEPLQTEYYEPCQDDSDELGDTDEGCTIKRVYVKRKLTSTPFLNPRLRRTSRRSSRENKEKPGKDAKLETTDRSSSRWNPLALLGRFSWSNSGRKSCV